MKGLSWNQMQSVIKQGKVEKAAVNAAAGSVDPSPTASMSAAALQMLTFGRPAGPAYPRLDELLVDLSPPPGESTYPQTRDYGTRQDAIGQQNVARIQAYLFSTSN